MAYLLSANGCKFLVKISQKVAVKMKEDPQYLLLVKSRLIESGAKPVNMFPPGTTISPITLVDPELDESEEDPTKRPEIHSMMSPNPKPSVSMPLAANPSSPRPSAPTQLSANQSAPKPSAPMLLAANPSSPRPSAPTQLSANQSAPKPSAPMLLAANPLSPRPSAPTLSSAKSSTPEPSARMLLGEKTSALMPLAPTSKPLFDITNSQPPSSRGRLLTSMALQNMKTPSLFATAKPTIGGTQNKPASPNKPNQVQATSNATIPSSRSRLMTALAMEKGTSTSSEPPASKRILYIQNFGKDTTSDRIKECITTHMHLLGQAETVGCPVISCDINAMASLATVTFRSEAECTGAMVLDGIDCDGHTLAFYDFKPYEPLLLNNNESAIKKGPTLYQTKLPKDCTVDDIKQFMTTHMHMLGLAEKVGCPVSKVLIDKLTSVATLTFRSESESKKALLLDGVTSGGFTCFISNTPPAAQLVTNTPALGSIDDAQQEMPRASQALSEAVSPPDRILVAMLEELILRREYVMKSRVKRVVFEDLCAALNGRGFQMCVETIKKKKKSMVNYYVQRKEVGDRSWRFFNLVGQLVGDRPFDGKFDLLVDNDGWNYDSTLCLIEEYGDRKELFKKAHNKNQLWSEIQAEVRLHFPTVTVQQCLDKWESLKEIYLDFKQQSNKSGNDNSVTGWDFFEPMNLIMCDSVSVHPEFTIATGVEKSFYRRDKGKDKDKGEGMKNKEKEKKKRKKKEKKRQKKKPRLSLAAQKMELQQKKFKVQNMLAMQFGQYLAHLGGNNNTSNKNKNVSLNDREEPKSQSSSGSESSDDDDDDDSSSDDE